MRTFLMATTVLAVSVTATFAQTPTPPFEGQPINSFFAKVGVDAHLAYSDGYGMYVNYTTLSSAMTYLGLNHIRDALPDPDGSNSTYEFNANTERLSVAGVQFDEIAGDWRHSTSKTKSEVDTLFAGVGPGASGPVMKAGSLTVVEGLNEITNQNPQVQLSTANSWQRDILCLAQTAGYCPTGSQDANLSGSKMAEFTSNGPVTPTASPSVNFPANYMNGHSYEEPSNAPGETTAAFIGGAFSQVYGVTANEYLSDTTKRISSPVPTLTESGAYAEPQDNTRTDATYANSYDEHTRAIKNLDTIFEGFSIGASTYIYQLLNNYTGDSDNRYGLFTYGGMDSNGNPIATPTISATAIHNLTAILKSSGTVQTPTANNCLQHTFSGAGGDFHSLMFQADNAGDYRVVLWRDDPADWNVFTHSPVAVEPEAITMNLAYAATAYTVDPIVSTAKQASYTSAKTFAIPLGDDPVVMLVHTSNAADTSCAN